MATFAEPVECGDGKVRLGSGDVDEGDLCFVQEFLYVAEGDSRTTNFVGYALATVGTNVVALTATDYSSNTRTNNYQVVLTNGPVAKTLTYDLNGNLITAVTATSTAASTKALIGRSAHRKRPYQPFCR